MDDETSVLLTLQLVFQEEGYAVTTADSEAQALEILRRPEKVDAVLTDMSMEHDQSGLEIANAAARLQPRPAIVIFTGSGTIENARGALGTAVDHFVMKPVDLDSFSCSSGDQLPRCPFSIFAHVFFSATVRLNTGFPGFESGSAQKYPMRSN